MNKTITSKSIEIKVYKTNGEIEDHSLKRPLRLKSLQKLIGGYIELVPQSHDSYNGIPENKILLCDEDGHHKRLTPNPKHKSLLGNVVLMDTDDFK